MSPLLMADITVFVLSLLVGFEVISKVPATLHTPLMSGANAIHGVVLVGVMLLAAMAPGSVVVDLAAGPLGGNVAGSTSDGRRLTENSVVVLGAGNLPAQVPRAASAAWARNVAALLDHLIHDGSVVLDPDDEITGGLLVCHDGKVVHSKETVS